MTSQPCKLRQLPTAQRGVQAQRCCAIERDAVLRVVRDEDAADMDAAHERVSAQPPPCLDWKRLLVPSMDEAAAAEAQSCRALSKFAVCEASVGHPEASHSSPRSFQRYP
jgi:hypothetical protein